MAKALSKKPTRSTAKPARPRVASAKPTVGRAAKAKPKAKPSAKSPARPAATRKTDQTAKMRKPAPMTKKPASAPSRPSPAQPPAALPANSKPRKNLAGLNARDLEHFRELLLARRRELVGDMSSMEREALRSGSATNLSNLPMHMADMGTDNYEQEFTLGLVEKDRIQLREINAALAKIQNGTYGICEGTGSPIARPRLEAQPWARYSIEYARKVERGEVRN